MANNFLKLLKPEAHLARNGFDLSSKQVFSSKPGMSVPCLAVETVVGDKFQIDLAGLTRTMTFNTAAFVRGKFSYDFFFIPNSQLWHPFNQFISQREDRHSTRQLQHACCPTISMGTILTFIAQEVLTYDSAGSTDCMQDIHGRAMFSDAVRLLDMLGYGDFRWFVELVRDEGDWTTDLIAVVDQFKDQYVNIFRLAAYQHVWYDFYRNKYYDTDTTGGVTSTVPSNYSRNYVEFFNFDDVACTGFYNSQFIVTSDITRDKTDNTANLASTVYRRLAGLLTIRFNQYKRDLFTSVLPSQQFGAISSVDVSALGYLKFEPDGTASTTTSVRYIPMDSPTEPNLTAYRSNQSVPATAGQWKIPSTFDVLQLRKAEALQAWKQNTLRAGNQVQDAFRAHFGQESYYEEDNCVKFLGSFDARLDVNTVTAQSAAAAGLKNNEVGDLAATGTSVVNGSKITFNPSDFGIIMCIAHYVPDVDYRANMLDKANRLYEQFDFFTPEFQNIGLESVVMADFDNSEGSAFANDTVGYAPHYFMYKTAYDKVHGEFNDGSLRHWVAPRSQVAVNSGAVPVSNFYIIPSFYNSVFGVNANINQNTDTFLHNVFFDIKAIRPMSELGLPQF